MSLGLTGKNITAVLMIAAFIPIVAYAENTTSSESSKDNMVQLDPASLKAADIQIIKLEPKNLTYFISAPGEVTPNQSLTTKVTTRVPAQVLQRYVQEGQHVKTGEPLVTLSSVDMAKTQGDIVLAFQEWERVKSLGRDAISAKRFSEAQVAYQHALSTALAYGLTETEVKDLIRSQKPSQAKGEFKLLAPRDGTVFNISFNEGELVEPGKILLQIIQETTVWIDAKLPPELVRPVAIGDKAQLTVNGRILTGKVIQVHHQLDEITRTRSIRIEVPNTADDFLHPGQYVNCQIASGKTGPVLALPVDAVLRTADGDWAVYVETKPGQFKPVEVKMGDTIGKDVVIVGIPPGTRVVTKGAFFVHAELNKKGFDAHGH